MAVVPVGCNCCLPVQVAALGSSIEMIDLTMGGDGMVAVTTMHTAPLVVDEMCLQGV